MGRQLTLWLTLFFFCSKITADGDCSHEIKRHLLLGRKVMSNLDSILQGRDITLPTKVHLVKTMVFLVVMYGCENWTIKKAECRGIDAFELWCWRRLLGVPWTARRSNQSIIKEINPEYALEGLMLKLQWNWPPDEIWLTGKDPDAGKGWGQEEKWGNRGWDGWMTSPTQRRWLLSKLREIVKDKKACHAAVHGITESDTT